MANNRKTYAAALLPGVDHLPHTHDLAQMAFTRGMPAWGAHLADELEKIVQLHDASTIAAVIVEPMQGSAGVIVPPVGYLERLRAICDRHGILLVFDEVITGFGRLGHYFGAERFGVTPDIITFAKGVNGGMIPLGGAIVRKGIYEACMHGPEHLVELFHGYTYSAHPLACAAGLAALEVYRDEALMARARALEPHLEAAVHALRGEPHVIDVRNLGLAAAIELEPRPGAATKRAMEVFHHCFDHGAMVRYTGDIVALGPAAIATPGEIDRIIEGVRQALRHIA
jgi:beta-alanine--pyruvate transaminase